LTAGIISPIDEFLGFCKVSDAIVDIEDFINGYTFDVVDKAVYSGTANEIFEMAPGVVVYMDSENSMFTIAFISEKGVGIDLDGITFPETGIYVDGATIEYSTTLVITFPNSGAFEVVKPLDLVYLPEHLHTIDEVNGGIKFEH
jgi:hypothetical protein